MPSPSVYTRSASEKEAAQLFLARFFPSAFAPHKLTRTEQALVDGILRFVGDGFDGAKMLLGLAIDFSAIAEKLSRIHGDGSDFRPDLTEDEIFSIYARKKSAKSKNTLSFLHHKTEVGIRAVENEVIDLFHGLGRTAYTSGAPHTTGQWHRYKTELMVPAFRLSSSGRYRLCNYLIDLGLARMSENRFYATRVQRPRLFEAIVREYDRTNRSGENSGAVFQGIAYGYFKADCPHLSLEVDKVRSGSRRQRRFGDIDGYHGLHLEISIEVKDMRIASDNASQIRRFLRDASDTRVQGIVFAKEIGEDILPDLAIAGVVPMTESSLLAAISLWDWQKQNIAVHGLLHFLSHIEQKPDGVRRLLEFMKEREPTHESVVFLDHIDDSVRQ